MLTQHVQLLGAEVRPGLVNGKGLGVKFSLDREGLGNLVEQGLGAPTVDLT